jgi:hypothetical protein
MGLLEEDARGKSARFLYNAALEKIEANMGHIVPTTPSAKLRSTNINKLRDD